MYVCMYECIHILNQTKDPQKRIRNLPDLFLN